MEIIKEFVLKINKYSGNILAVFLLLSVLIYFLLYGASGHRFDLDWKDYVFIITFILASLALFTYSNVKDRDSKIFGKVILVSSLPVVFGIITYSFYQILILEYESNFDLVILSCFHLFLLYLIGFVIIDVFKRRL
jgi:hypothetical protein